MASMKLVGLKRCSTCIKAMAWLDEQGQTYEFIDYRDQPIQAQTLLAWKDQLGGWEKLVNRASMTWRQLPQERKTPSEDTHWLELIAQFPTLVRRPIRVDKDGQVSAGFSIKKYAELMG